MEVLSQKTETVKIEKAKPFFTIETKEAKKNISILKKVIKSSGVLPILDCVLIIIDGAGVKLIATDLESHLTITPKVFTYGGETTIAVNANYLQWFINKAFEKEITFEFIGDKCNMICGKFHIVVETEKAEGYPKPPTHEIKRSFQVEKDFIGKMATAIKFVSNDDLRPAMTGVYLHSDNEQITIVSTDAHRMYFHKTDIKIDEVFECILPQKGVRIILEAFKKGGLFEVDANRVRVSTEDCELSVRKIDAKFPNYQTVLPQTVMSIFINRKDLLNYLSLAYYFANLSTHQVRVNLKKDYAELITGSEFAEDVVNKISISKTMDAEYTFGINAHFLYDAVVLSSEEFVEIKTAASPTKAMIVDEHIFLMPLMLGDHF